MYQCFSITPSSCSHLHSLQLNRVNPQAQLITHHQTALPNAGTLGFSGFSAGAFGSWKFELAESDADRLSSQTLKKNNNNNNNNSNSSSTSNSNSNNNNNNNNNNHNNNNTLRWVPVVKSAVCVVCVFSRSYQILLTYCEVIRVWTKTYSSIIYV